MIIKGLIDKNYKISNKDILHFTEDSPDDEVYFAFDSDLEENQTSSLPLIGTQETPVSNFEEKLSNSLPFIGSQTNLTIQSKSDDHHKEFDDINAKIMALKAFLWMKYTHFKKIFHLCRKNVTNQFC